MKRRLIAVMLMLAIGLQGSMAAFASTSSLMSTDCRTAAISHSAISHSDASQNACCPKGQHAMSCCLDMCFADVGISVSQTALVRYARSAPSLPDGTSTFSSRGDSPLIRPPIL